MKSMSRSAASAEIFGFSGVFPSLCFCSSREALIASRRYASSCRRDARVGDFVKEGGRNGEKGK